MIVTDDSDVIYPTHKWVEIEILEVGRATTMEGEKFVAIAVSFSDPDVSDMTFFHPFKSREDIENFITCLRVSTDKIWPVS